jgi:hypothetical protein
MMVSEVPQIDLSSLSRQQLQHLLETSRRAGRTGMADAVAKEMRDRRAQPEAPRSWVEVEFGELASEPDLELAPEPELQRAAAPVAADTSDEPPEVAPHQDLAPVGPADPYAFSSLRTVPDGGLRISRPAARRTAGRPARTPLAKTGARTTNPRPGPARAAVIGGVVALGLAAAVAMIPLQRSPPPARAPAPAQVATQAAPSPPQGAADAEVLPRASTARLALRGPITSAAESTAGVASPATPAPPPSRSPEFTISAADLQAAAERANRAEMAKFHGEGLQGTWLTPDFAPARCRWSPADTTLAVCQTRARYAGGPWRERTGHYRRNADGAWQVAP